jgi:hypothetical protein
LTAANWGGVIADVVGLAIDTAAAATPGVLGGAAAINAGKKAATEIVEPADNIAGKTINSAKAKGRGWYCEKPQSVLGGASKKTVTSMGKADAVQYQKLKQQLASQKQMGELAVGQGKPLIGAGTNRTLRDADRLAAEYGGNASDWAKVSSSNKGHVTGYNQETHAYMNTKTGQVVEMKTKISGH